LIISLTAVAVVVALAIGVMGVPSTPEARAASQSTSTCHLFFSYMRDDIVDIASEVRKWEKSCRWLPNWP
jgi:hypothetical protein